MRYRCENCGTSNEIPTAESLECRCVECGVRPSFHVIAKKAAAILNTLRESAVVTPWGERITYPY